MRLSDYLAKRLQEFLIEDIFMVTGGAAMHLNDGFARMGILRFIIYIMNNHVQWRLNHMED